MLTVRWLGVAGLEFSYDGQVLLIDPYLSRPTKIQTLLFPLKPDPPRINKYLGQVEGRILAILAGHTHSDHVLDMPFISEKCGAPGYGTQSLFNLYQAYGKEEKVKVVKPGRKYSIGPFEVVPIESVHGRVFLGKVPFPGVIKTGLKPPLRVNQFRHGGPFAWHITVDGTRFLHLGSADFIEENLKGIDVDVLFPCAAGRQYTPDFARRLLNLTQPTHVVPFHFDDFSVPIDQGDSFPHVPGVDLEGFIKELKDAAPDAEIVVPKPFAPLDLA